MERIKLNIGTGGSKIPGFKNLDAVQFGNTDFVYELLDENLQAGKVIPFGSVEIIYCSHCLEHFGFPEATKVLELFKKLLVPTGKLYLAVPDFRKCALAYINGNHTAYLLGFIYGNDENSYNNHKSGWTEEYLMEVLNSVGFIAVDTFKPFVRNAQENGFDASCSWLEDAGGNKFSLSINLICEIKDGN